jgi:hypothetical protein
VEKPGKHVEETEKQWEILGNLEKHVHTTGNTWQKVWKNN